MRSQDTREDLELKLKVLEIYNHRLDERERRKNFILQQGLLVRNKDDNKRKWGREEKELHKKLDIFQRFSSKEVHDKFISELNTEIQSERSQRYKITDNWVLELTQRLSSMRLI